MEPDARDEFRQARELRDASRRLREQATASIEKAQQRLDLARNTLQATWLWRVVRERLRGQHD